MLNDIIKIWRLDLQGLIGFYENRKSQTISSSERPEDTESSGGSSVGVGGT